MVERFPGIVYSEVSFSANRSNAMKTKSRQHHFHLIPRALETALFACVPFLMATSLMGQMPGANPGRGPSLPTGVKAERNVPYVDNGHRNQVLDLYLPEKPSDKPLPLMIWIHGGAWMGGSQANPPVLYLVNQGFAVASVQYRFVQDAIWPAQAYDCKAAIRFLRANAARYNFDPDRFGVGGD